MAKAEKEVLAATGKAVSKKGQTDTKVKKKKKKAVKKSVEVVAEKAVEVVVEKPKKTPQLPKEVSERKILCKEKMSSSKENVDVSEIVATAKYIYVNDIHSHSPVVLAEQRWVTLKDSRFVVAVIGNEDYEYLLKKKKKHLLIVVDCAQTPTLSYSFDLGKLHNGEFPTFKEIEAKDREFRENPTQFHNPYCEVTIKKPAEKTEEEIQLDDEEEFEIDFS